MLINNDEVTCVFININYHYVYIYGINIVNNIISCILFCLSAIIFTGCGDHIYFSEDDIEIISTTTYSILESNEIWPFDMEKPSGVLALNPKTMNFPSPRLCAANISESRPDIANDIKKRSIEWPSRYFNHQEVAASVNHLIIFTNSKYEHVYWGIEKVEEMNDHFPEIKGFVGLNRPVYLTTNRAFICIDYGPSPHASFAHFELMKTNNRWNIVWEKYLHVK